MNFATMRRAALVIVCAGALVAFADETKPAKAPKPGKLTKPWVLLTTLSDDQKEQIITIHRKALDEKKAIEAKEEEDIMAVLTAEQKTELEAAIEKAKADEKAKKAAEKKADQAE